MTRIGTVLNGGVHMLCVTADAANAAVLIDMFGMGGTAIATALSGTVYSLALSGLAPPYDPEALAYFNAASITYPSDQATAINDFIVGLKADFAITLLTDVFDQLILQANESAAAAVVDMCGRIDQTLVNNPTFTQWQGVTGSRTGGERYVYTNFNPTTGAVRYTQNSHAMGFFCRSGTGSEVMGANNSSFAGTAIYIDIGGGQMTFKDSNASAMPTVAEPRTGLFALSRTASNAWACYQDGTSLGTSTASPIAFIDLTWTLCGANDYENFVGATVQSALSFISRGMTSGEMAAFNALVQTLKAAIGW